MIKILLIATVGVGALAFTMRAKASPTNATINTDTGSLFNADNLMSTPPKIDSSLIMPVVGSNETIAVRNNNPLNIRETKDNWVGLASPRAKNGFFNFTKPEFGFRAAAKIVFGAYKKRGIETISQVISEWAPGHENNTPAYIKYVSDRTKLSPNTKITGANVAPIFQAMAKMESGKEYPLSTIQTGVIIP